MFNDREIASAIWLIVFALWALSKRDIRKAAAQVVRTLFHPKIVLCFLLMTVYTMLAVAMLAQLGFWHADLTKDTVLWVCFSGLWLILDFVGFNGEDNDRIFRRIFFDNVKALILLEFLINTYTLSLPGELLFIPFVSVLAALDAFAHSDYKYASVARVTRNVLAIIGLSLIGFAVASAVEDYRNLGNLDTLRSLALPPLLSIMFSPFVYAAVLISTYEQIFLRLKLGPEKTTELLRYARRRIVLRFGMRLLQLRVFMKVHGFELMSVRSTGEVDRILHGTQLVHGDRL